MAEQMTLVTDIARAIIESKRPLSLKVNNNDSILRESYMEAMEMLKTASKALHYEVDFIEHNIITEQVDELIKKYERVVELIFEEPLD